MHGIQYQARRFLSKCGPELLIENVQMGSERKEWKKSWIKNIKHVQTCAVNKYHVTIIFMFIEMKVILIKVGKIRRSNKCIWSKVESGSNDLPAMCVFKISKLYRTAENIFRYYCQYMFFNGYRFIQNKFHNIHNQVCSRLSKNSKILTKWAIQFDYIDHHRCRAVKRKWLNKNIYICTEFCTLHEFYVTIIIGMTKKAHITLPGFTTTRLILKNAKKKLL